MKCLVLGCGSIGRRHLLNLQQLGVSELACCDTSSVVAAKINEEIGVPMFRNCDDALEWQPDGVLVCTPTHLHLPLARRALAAGAHVFIEKPLGSDLADVDNFADLAARTSRIVLCAANLRFHAGVRHLKRALTDGLVGRPWLLRAHFSHYLPKWRPSCDYRRTYSASAAEGGGIILEGVHEIDYVLWLCGTEAKLAGAVGAHVSALETDCEDTALIALRFSSGAIAEIHLDCLRPVKSRGCEITGSLGSVRWQSDGKSPERIVVEWCPLASSSWQPLFGADAYDPNEMYVDEMRHFLACMRGEEQPIVTVADAARVVKLAAASRRALQVSTHEAPRVFELSGS